MSVIAIYLLAKLIFFVYRKFRDAFDSETCTDAISMQLISHETSPVPSFANRQAA